MTAPGDGYLPSPVPRLSRPQALSSSKNEGEPGIFSHMSDIQGRKDLSEHSCSSQTLNKGSKSIPLVAKWYMYVQLSDVAIATQTGGT